MIHNTKTSMSGAGDLITQALVSTQKALLAAADNISKLAAAQGVQPRMTTPSYSINRARGLRAAQTRAYNRQKASEGRSAKATHTRTSTGRGNHIGKLSDEDEANLAVLLKDTTIPVAKLAPLFGVTRAAVYMYRDRAGLDARKAPHLKRNGRTEHAPESSPPQTVEATPTPA